jgi:hypothetical protein
MVPVNGFHAGILEFVAEGMVITPYWVCAISELLFHSSVVLPEKYIPGELLYNSSLVYI